MATASKVEPQRTKVLRADQLSDKIAVLTGTRPGIIKFSPLIRELIAREVPYFLVHSGQHYSPEMDAAFFRDLELPEPHYRLDSVRNYKLHGEQTAEMLRGIEAILVDERPKILVVGGDCNTHLAGALAARKLHIPVAHVEAGMRSWDWRMPEEHNRALIDHISELLFVHGQSAVDNMRLDGVRGQIHVVGTTITDAVNQNLQIAHRRSRILEHLDLKPDGYFLVTCHREENVDDRKHLRSILQALDDLGKAYRKRVVFPAHPRTQKRIEQFDLSDMIDRMEYVDVIEPLGYLDFLVLLSNARLFLTDSGGGQQEACILHVPCVTLRISAEWTETLRLGANILVGADRDTILEGAATMLHRERGWENPFGDGRAAVRIVDVLVDVLQNGIPQPGLEPTT